MTRDDIIRMAREAGVLSGYEGEPDNLVRFAELVAAAERAASRVCAEEVKMQYAIDVLQAGIIALERAGIRDHRISELKEAIKRLEGQ